MFSLFKKKEKKQYHFPPITSFDMDGTWVEYGLHEATYEIYGGRFTYTWESDETYHETAEGRVEITDGCFVTLIFEHSKTVLDGVTEEDSNEVRHPWGYYVDGTIFGPAESVKEKNNQLTLTFNSDVMYLKTILTFKDGNVNSKSIVPSSKNLIWNAPYTVDGDNIYYELDSESKHWITKYEGDYFSAVYEKK